MNGERKLQHLEGMRGLAACAVVLAHFFQVLLPAMFERNPALTHTAFDRFAPQTPLNGLWNGNFAVCLFFVLSGYVLSVKSFRGGDRLAVAESLLRRYFRLALPALASVLLCWCLMAAELSFYPEASKLTLATMPDPWSVTPTLAEVAWQTIWHTFFSYGMAYNPVLWTMTYEWFGSLSVFAVLLAFGGSRRHGWRLARLLAYAGGIGLSWNTYYLGFWLGMIACDWSPSRDRSASAGRSGAPLRNLLRRSGIAAGTLGAVGFYLGSYPYVSPPGPWYDWLPVGQGFPLDPTGCRIWGSFLLLLGLLLSPRVQHLLTGRAMRMLGRLSFSVYLVHFAVLCSWSSWLFARLHSAIPYPLAVAFTVLLSVPPIALLSIVFECLIDRPLLRGLKRLRLGRGSTVFDQQSDRTRGHSG
ncbi:Peptidoglycan/LPS O-acetylase OafA/YrhL, contains acyltransferase and SGNH-hydrolase domains [Paenibacillus sp. UNC496MF]|uniref:acyltransferase family protein n=1 Tax=Paenibacillus sp. UNC496MF TaxID=1502753 RepID=UPI0008EA00E9|nr:acyltransferase [Paenibacillus sp. UNC496MF]SFJ59737.1 Peptidoglycan/LPS O-acetylase OafA/YrhL, contains acyltransferase and SGNH-hydrolase domains [Paenibacillus sp. UNC496MF]